MLPSFQHFHDSVKFIPVSIEFRTSSLDGVKKVQLLLGPLNAILASSQKGHNVIFICNKK
jgi:hypothetical protein